MHSSETIKVVPARYPLRVVGALVALLVLAVVIQSVAFNPRWEWGVFARWFFDPVILEGLGQTLLLTLLGTVLSVIFGGLLALARLSSSWLLSSLAWGYIALLAHERHLTGHYCQRQGSLTPGKSGAAEVQRPFLPSARTTKSIELLHLPD